MSITSVSPTTGYARFSTVVFPTIVPVTVTVTTGTTPVTMTVAQVLAGLLRVDTQDAGTLTTPTAAAIVSAIEDALSPFGVRIAQTPIRPMAIVRMVNEGKLRRKK